MGEPSEPAAWVALVHEGPDGPGFELVVAPEGPPPPTVSSGPARVTVVLDGRLYDHGPLHGALSAGPAPKTGEAELVLRAYLAWGEGMLARLEGAFALVVWDGRTGTLVGVRDPVGVHPLFYARLARGLALSTSIEGLVRHSSTRWRPNRLVVAAHLLDVAPRRDATYIEGVSRVPAGHALRFRRGAVDLRRYWDPEAGPEPPRDPSVAVRRFEELMRKAVGRCLQEEPTAVYLSGGRDSATVALTAAEVSAQRGLRPPLALSLTFPGLASDEAHTQARVARELGLPQLAIPYARAVGADRPLGAALRLTGSSPSAPAGLLQPAYDHLARTARAHGRHVVLTGDGGDEWLLPSPYYTADALHALDLRGVHRAWRAWWRFYPLAGRRRVLWTVVWTWGAKQLLRSSAAAAARRPRLAGLEAYRIRRVLESMPAWLAPDPQLRMALVERALDEQPQQRGRMDAEYKRALLEHPNLSLDLERAFADRRRLGVHVRMPFLDLDVIRFLYRTPPPLLLGSGQPKWLASEVLAARLGLLGAVWPATVAGDSIWVAALRSEGAKLWDALGGVPALHELGVVDATALRRALDDAAAGAASADGPIAIVEALNLENWLRSHVI